MSTALQSRMVHLHIAPDFDAWMAWANKNKIDHRIKSFLNFKPSILHNFDPSNTDFTYPCPRTWEFVSRIISPITQLSAEDIPVIAGAVGEGAGREFFSFSQIYSEIPTIKDIMSNPTTVPIKNEPSIHYALAGLVTHHMNEKTIGTLLQFLKRLSIDFQVISLRALPDNLKLSKEISIWASEIAEQLD